MFAHFEKVLPKITLVVLLAATVLRVVVWLQQRSIFMDEANLIRNWIEKSYPDLWAHLDYEQYCPPIFSCLSKLIINVLGVSELTIRVLPLVSGIAMIWVFYVISKRFFSPLTLLFSVAFVGFSFLFLRYSTECKQYSTDGLVALLLIFLALKNGEKTFSWRESLTWSAVGAVVIWTSMPAVFVLAGVGFYFFLKNFDHRKSWFPIFAAAIFWIANFGFYFFKILKSEATSDYLQNWHQPFFFVFPPKNLAEFARLGQQLQDIVSMSFGKTVVALLVATVGFFIGLRRFWKNDRAVFWLFSLPILATLTASALHFYSMFGRLILFLIPFFMFLIFSGLDEVLRFEKSKNRQFWYSKILAIALILIAFFDFQQAPTFVSKFRTEWPEIHDGLKFLEKEMQSDEAFFVDFEEAPAVRFYTEHQKNRVILPNLVLQKYECCNPDLKLQGLRAVRATGFQKIWVIQSDRAPKFLENEPATIVKTHEFYGGKVILYQFE